MKQFEIGKTYYARSACNYNCIFEITILKRTAKTVTIFDDADQCERRVKIHKDESGEYITPYNYSMAPLFRPQSNKKPQKLY
ncbi:hypothetical protein QJU93_07215 [Pasteurella skyensis]|uniref:Uncharacterized protein n=1 Tax=Phocoenobacter skyensis TaxID=97481 RepID=A0AAJ6P112_9PAST|nr:hypothetical protein [Pasteurella skyensis]MDP8173145.1 hypothetical protein [Pasteurella skyensis]MDP8178922.1 hypothetical protein [Pasteurella skyensis]